MEWREMTLPCFRVAFPFVAEIDPLDRADPFASGPKLLHNVVDEALFHNVGHTSTTREKKRMRADVVRGTIAVK